ncbi:DnaB-like helicase N-terminal domain-containing protein [Kitasatospora cinereorecta]|uniref:DnaB-like helicase N-terminal domain-containing protein n=1 Tax=Kitasatospora cinereorecta TaxID=285560 RepID=A0ABW0VPC9_9ACTN
MSTPAAAYAESALLGALLQDPRRAVEVRDWVRAEDFADPWNREIYRALIDHGLYSHPEVLAQPAQLRPWQLGRLVIQQLHHAALAQGWQVRPEDWMQVAGHLTNLPQQVPNAAHAADYGRAVAQASMERTVGPFGEFAEQAILAAVLARPEEAERLRGWLHAEDFTDPWMGQMYRVLVEEGLATHPAVTVHHSSPDQQRVLAEMLYQELQRKAVLQGWGISQDAWPQVAAQVRDLIGVHRPAHPELAAQIGQRVLRSSIQRQVAEAGARIERTLAWPGAPSAAMEIGETLTLLRELEDHWERAVGRFEGVGGSIAPDRAAQRPEMAFTEDAVLGSLMRDPGQLAHVRDWLRPEDFTHPGRAEVYTAMIEAVDAGGTIDPVLLVWDAHRRQPRSAQQLSSDAVWAIYQAGRPGVVQGGARALVEASIVHHVRSATSAIARAAGDPTAAPGHVIATARGHLQQASAQATRLSQARRPAPAPSWAG